jgi:hypothetical protein
MVERFRIGGQVIDVTPAIDGCFGNFVMNADGSNGLETQKRIMVAFAVVIRTFEQHRRTVFVAQRKEQTYRGFGIG